MTYTKYTYSLLLVFALVAFAIPQPAYAIAFGFGLGSARLTTEGESNVEKINPDLNSKITSSPTTFNLQIHGGINDNLFFEVGIAGLSSIEKEQKRNNIPTSDPLYRSDKVVAYKISTVEDYTALYGAVGLALFVTDQFAVYGKGGLSIISSEYSYKQVLNVDNSNIIENEDNEYIGSVTDLGRYLAIGMLYNITDNFLVKFDIEDFGVVGAGAEISDTYLPGTVDHPEATGSLVQRMIVHGLIRF